MKFLLFGLLNGPEVVVILALALVLFGAKRLPELARSLGSGLREFKKATREVTDDLQNALYEEPHAAPKQLPVASANTVPASDPAQHAASPPAVPAETVEHPVASPSSHS